MDPEPTLDLLDQRVDLELRRITACIGSTSARLDEKIEGFKADVDKRLDYLNGVRESLRDQAGRMATKEEVEARLDAVQDKIESMVHNLEARNSAEFKPINEKLAQLGKPNWSIVGTVASFAAATIAAVWLIIGLKISAELAPVSLNVEQIKVADASRDRQLSDNSTLGGKVAQETLSLTQRTSSVESTLTGMGERLRVVETASTSSQQADVASRTDRMQLNDRTRILENELGRESSERKANEAGAKSDQKESEAQFKSISVMLNLTKDHFSQLFGVLWQKVFPGQQLPATPYRPQLWRDLP